MDMNIFALELCYIDIIIINGIFTQDNPSVLSTVINGVLLTNKLEIIKIYKLKTIKNYNRNYNRNYNTNYNTNYK